MTYSNSYNCLCKFYLKHFLEYKSLQNELDGVRMELNYTKNNYTELRGKCDELQTMNANDTSKNETKNKNDSGKNKNDSGKPTPTKTASTTQHAKVETEKVASVKKTIQGHAIIKTTQKPITKSIGKYSVVLVAQDYTKCNYKIYCITY